MRRIIVCVVGLLALAACGSDDKPTATTSAPTEFDFAHEAEQFIHDPNGEVAKQMQMQFGRATCEQPFNTQVGQTYKCTAPTEDGTVWEFVVEITGPTHYTVQDAAPQ